MSRQQTMVKNQIQQQPSESKGDKFRRLIIPRVDRTVNGLKLIGNLSELSKYSYTESEVRQVFEAIEKTLDEARMRFSQAASKNGRKGFHFE